jgi:hypothetical protein
VLIVVPLETREIKRFFEETIDSSVTASKAPKPEYSSVEKAVGDMQLPGELDALRSLNALNKTVVEREQHKLDIINSDSIGMLVFFVLLLIMTNIVLYERLRVTSKNDPIGNPNGTDLLPIFIHVVVNVIVLAFFQYQVFLYGKQFKYPGTQPLDETYTGKEEILAVLMKTLKEAKFQDA